MRVRPEGLRVREEGVQRRDARRDPEVGRRPAVGPELGWCGERERVGLEEGERVNGEEACVWGDLWMSLLESARECRDERRTYEAGEKERPRRGGHCRERVRGDYWGDEIAEKVCTRYAVEESERQLGVERGSGDGRKRLDESLHENIQ